MKKLYLVDVSSMFFRAFYAVRTLSNSQGLPTNAIYGFLSMSVKLLKDVKPDYLVYCYDQPGPSFRKDLYPEYKANRSETPEDLIPQIPYVKKLTETLGIPGIGLEKYEADDVIGSLAKFGQEQGLEVVIVSGDKDFAQLVNDKVSILDTMKDIQYTPETVLEKWGVRPDQFIDYLAITGDSSDNIPGVRGVGPKGAQTLLEKYDNLENIYQHVDSLSAPALKKKLHEAKEMAYLSRQLVTIVTDLNLVEGLNDVSLKPIDQDKLSVLLDELEFGTFKKKLIGDGERAMPSVKSDDVVHSPVVNYQCSDVTLLDLKNRITDYDSLRIWKDSRYFLITKGQQIFSYSEDRRELGTFLKEKNIKWSGYDLKEAWKELGISTGEVSGDLMLAAYVLKSGPVQGLGELLQEYLGEALPEFPQPSDLMQAYDKVETVILQKLKEQKMLPILQTVDLPLIEVLASMEAKGILLDSQVLQRQSEEVAEEISELEIMIKAEAQEDFNVASPKQLAVVLFDKLGLSKGKKTKTGFSTASDVLEKIENEHSIVSLILRFRELSKLKSTYLDSLPQLVDAETGRIHTVFNQALTTTGRLSSNHPNLQNIPIRTERGRQVREAFVVPKGSVLVSADYSQIELRILAHITQDPGLIEAFKNDRDIHTWTASEIFAVALDEVDSNQRRMAKAVNFGIAYGQGAYGLAETLQISRTESKAIIENYFKKFPGVKNYMEEIVRKATEQGYVETLFGRRRYLPELFSKNQMQRSFGERAAINAPIQGTAADLVKMAMLELFEDFKDSMLVQVHDELLFEVGESSIDSTAEQIRETMENNVRLSVPLKVNVSWGQNWSEAH